MSNCVNEERKRGARRSIIAITSVVLIDIKCSTV